MTKKGKKISIIGAGFVGATIAYTLTLDGMATEIVLVDVNKDKAKGEAMDILQGTPFTQYVDIYSGDYPDVVDSDIVIFTAGIGRKPGQTRIDLTQTNVNIIKSIVPEVVKYAPNAIYVVVSNPVDIITYVISKISGKPQSEIVGSGTMLDTARLRSSLAEATNVPAQNVHAYVLGEHGDTSFSPWSLATIAGLQMKDFYNSLENREIDKDVLDGIVDDMRTSGAKVIASKGATYYAIAMTVRRLCDAILRDTNSILTVSTLMNGQYGLEDVCVSIPCMVGGQGVTRQLEVPLTDDEKAALINSSDSLKEIINSINI